MRFALPLFFLPLTLLVYSCHRTDKSSATALPPKIKVIRESFHEPGKYAETVEYEPELADQTFLVQTTFNQLGRVTQVEKLNERGKVEWREVNHYDNGKLQETTFFHFKKVTGRRINKFDTHNRLIASNEFDSDGNTIAQLRFQHDSAGIRTGIRLIRSRTALKKKAESRMNEKGDTLETRYFSDGRLTQVDRNLYDDRGRLSVSTRYDHLLREQRIALHQYDSGGNAIETVVLNGSRIMEARIRRRFDRYGRAVEIFTYDIRGNLKEHAKHAIEYDSYGNWIKDIQIVNRRPVSIRVRKVEYH